MHYFESKTVHSTDFSFSETNNISSEDITELEEIKQQLISELNDGNIYLNPDKEYYNRIIGINGGNIRPLMAIVPDYKYIHVEFRGLLPWDIIETNLSFTEEVKTMYNSIIQHTNSEIYRYKTR